MTIAEQLREEGKLQGIQQGVQRGTQQAAEAIARKMLDKGMPVESVRELTDLSAEQIEKLKH